MNRKYWNDLADRFDVRILDIAANEASGTLGKTIKTLGEKHQTAGDFGCGAGATTALLSAHFDKIVAVDFAEKLLAVARKRVLAKNVDFIQADLCKKAELPFRVEVSFCFNALIHPLPRSGSRLRSQFSETRRPMARRYLSFLRSSHTCASIRR
jgi:SAM-dependent methyltransferase